MEFASKNVAGAGLGLGVAGTALGILNGGLGNILGGLGGNAVCSESTMVNRYELNMTQQMANKDMEIAYWRGQDETNRKISETYANLESQINNLAKEVRCNKNEQNGINLQQAVYNGTANAAMSCMQGQIAQLFSLTRLVVPNSSVCPGYGDVTITPATTPTTTG